MTRKISPFGSWQSPITSDLIVQDAVSLQGLLFEDENLYWLEGLPSEGGRNRIMKKLPSGETVQQTPAPFNVRTRVHEYGGAPFTVLGQRLYFSNFEDNLLYMKDGDNTPRAITADSHHRYADAGIDRVNSRLYWVREDHTHSSLAPETTIVMMDAEGQNEQIVVSGNDFYSNPRISPDSKHIAYLTWNHPHMPWDESELWVAEIKADGTTANARKLAGGSGISIVQPAWSPGGTLYFISDHSNWWNLMRCFGSRKEEVCPVKAEFGSHSTVLGKSDYCFIDENTIIASYSQHGMRQLASIDVWNGRLNPITTPYTFFASIQSNGSEVAFIAASPTEFLRVAVMDTTTRKIEDVRVSSGSSPDPDYLSQPEAIEFPTADQKTAHALFYAPTNRDFAAPHGEKPPLLVHVHGGPVGATTSALNLTKQYWTSRGFAIVDVNYGGSTGYGRGYRERLRGQWGIVDVADCANAVRYLIDRGEVDATRIAISGGSAGGYTTLASLVFTDIYHAGASHFGLSDLESFARETHKFESHYLHGLVAPYPQQKQVYIDRSPIHFTERLSCPVIFFQGLDDKVVPPNQAVPMVEALRKKGVPVAYLEFKGEGHGFRKAENIKRSIDGEFYFYSKIFGFEPADAIEPVQIENLQQ